MYHTNLNVNSTVENVTRIKSGITINIGASVQLKKKKEIRLYEKDYIWNPATCSCESNKYVLSITDDWVIAHDEIIDTTKSI